MEFNSSIVVVPDYLLVSRCLVLFQEMRSAKQSSEILPFIAAPIQRLAGSAVIWLGPVCILNILPALGPFGTGNHSMRVAVGSTRLRPVDSQLAPAQAPALRSSSDSFDTVATGVDAIEFSGDSKDNGLNESNNIATELYDEL